MTKDILLFGSVVACLAILLGTIILPPSHPAFIRVSALLGVVGFFAGACIAEVINL